MGRGPKGVNRRDSQYPAKDYRAGLAKHGLCGSMGRRGNPYDDAEADLA